MILIANIQNLFAVQKIIRNIIMKVIRKIVLDAIAILLMLDFSGCMIVGSNASVEHSAKISAKESELLKVQEGKVGWVDVEVDSLISTYYHDKSDCSDSVFDMLKNDLHLADHLPSCFCEYEDVKVKFGEDEVVLVQAKLKVPIAHRTALKEGEHPNVMQFAVDEETGTISRIEVSANKRYRGYVNAVLQANKYRRDSVGGRVWGQQEALMTFLESLENIELFNDEAVRVFMERDVGSGISLKVKSGLRIDPPSFY